MGVFCVFLINPCSKTILPLRIDIEQHAPNSVLTQIADLIGGCCRIRTRGHHRLNLATANIINNLQGMGQNCKSLKRQTEHNKVSLILHELCMRGMPAEDRFLRRKVLLRVEEGRD